MKDDGYVIETKGLVKRFNKDIIALNDISFKIKKGEVVGYLGPNGAGKTTTIKILTNLIKPTSGYAYINGIDVNKFPKRALKNVGALIEVPGVYDYLTPDDLLKYFGKLYRMSKVEIDARIDEILEMVNLSDWRYKKIHSFSTGMERRLAIAKSILHDPEILILDEPVLGLDPKGIREIREMIKGFQDYEMTVLLSSHLLDEVSRTCDSVIFLSNGEIIGHDSVENINHILSEDMIDVELLNRVTETDLEKLREIEGVESISQESVNKIKLKKATNEIDSTASILRRMVEEGYDIVSYTPKQSNLEDFYVDVMDNREGKL